MVEASAPLPLPLLACGHLRAGCLWPVGPHGHDCYVGGVCPAP